MTTAVDLFAGAGGFTEGARRAGVRVLWAANHWRVAVDVHRANHPDAVHLCQDLHQADWSQVPAHDVLLASPACTGHTRARGKDRPHHDAARATAWAVVSCAEAHRPAAIVVENVPEFLAWALFPSWQDALHRLGYAVAPHVVDAADLGVPQHRTRAILVCTRSRAPLQLDAPRRPHVPAAAVVDWNDGRWTQVRKPGRSAATLARIEQGRRQFGRRFVAPFYGSGSGLTGRSLDRPIGTLTTRARWAVVDGERMRMLTIAETAAFMDFPRDYQLPANVALANHLLGNAVPPAVPAWVLGELRARGAA